MYAGKIRAAERLTRTRAWWAKQFQVPDVITRQQRRWKDRNISKRIASLAKRKARRLTRTRAWWAKQFQVPKARSLHA